MKSKYSNLIDNRLGIWRNVKKYFIIILILNNMFRICNHNFPIIWTKLENFTNFINAKSILNLGT